MPKLQGDTEHDDDIGGVDDGQEEDDDEEEKRRITIAEVGTDTRLCCLFRRCTAVYFILYPGTLYTLHRLYLVYAVPRYISLYWHSNL